MLTYYEIAAFGITLVPAAVYFTRIDSAEARSDIALAALGASRVRCERAKSHRTVWLA